MLPEPFHGELIIGSGAFIRSDAQRSRRQQAADARDGLRRDNDLPMPNTSLARWQAPTPSGELAADGTEVREVVSGYRGDGSEGAGSADGMNLRRLLQLMRGRYWIAITLSIVLAGAGAFAGFSRGKKTYESVGLIRVIAVVPRVLYNTDDKGMLPMFDSFVDTQVSLLRSQRVLDFAVADPQWTALNRGGNDKAVLDFAKNLQVSREGEMIQVRAVDLDPTAAVTEVQTVIRAYQKLYDELDAVSDQKRLDVLQARQTTLGNELASIRERILDVAKAYGTDDLKSVYQAKQDHFNKVDAAIADKQLELAAVSQSPAAATTLKAVPFTYEQWAMVSPEMAQLLGQQRMDLRKLEELKAKQVMPKNPTFLEAQALLDSSNRALDQLAQRLEADRSASGSAAAENPPVAGSKKVNQGELEDQIKSLKLVREALHSDLMTLGQQQLNIQQLQQQEEQVKQERNETRQRLDQLNLEATISGRIDIVSPGDRPLGPNKDTRIPYAAGGGLGGGVFGFGIIMGFALLDRRLRSADEASGCIIGAPMLGLLPQLPEDLSDPAMIDMAAHCVHSIRTLLQIWSHRRTHRVFAITSPSSGAGKTGLTLALGVSYASSKLKTLVVDLDFVAGGMSHRAGATVQKRLGEILLNQKIVTEQQLSDALASSRSGSRRLGEVLIQRGWLSESALSDALRSQQQSQVGVIDLLRGRAVNQCVSETGVPNLHVLPVGSATPRDIALLSPELLLQSVERLRDEYDIVLIDTGPLLGSLEASLIVSLVDGVLLTVSKGDSRPLIERTMSQLVSLGARVAGAVFNRASAFDVSRHGSSGASQTRSQRKSGAEHLTRAVQIPVHTRHLGPLASAVASSAPTAS